jgi:hypothetical protein
MKYYNLNSYLLRQKKQDNNLSTQTLAKCLKRSVRTTQRMLSGQQDKIDYFVLLRAAKKLKVNPSSLLKSYSNKQIKQIFGNDDLPF